MAALLREPYCGTLCTIQQVACHPLASMRRSEGDGLSGLVVDVLGDRLVVASSAAWVQR